MHGGCIYSGQLRDNDKKLFLLLSGVDDRSLGIVMLIVFAETPDRHTEYTCVAPSISFSLLHSLGDQNNCLQSFLHPLFTQLFVSVYRFYLYSVASIIALLPVYTRTPWRSTDSIIIVIIIIRLLEWIDIT